MPEKDKLEDDSVAAVMSSRHNEVARWAGSTKTKGRGLVNGDREGDGK